MPSKLSPADNSDVLVVGGGYLGSRVAEFAVRAGARAFATTRSTRRAELLQSTGVLPICFDWTDPNAQLPQSLLRPETRVLIAVSYDRNSPADRRTSQVGGLRRLLGLLPAGCPICYISTTGVYHQTDGRWVDESSPTFPSRMGGRVHLEAERLLARRRPNSPWVILRLAGIYGRGRVPRAADVIAGRPIASPAHGFLNLIHVDDAALAVLSAWDWMQQSPPASTSFCERLFVVSDDRPVPRGDFYREIARRCGAATPRFVPPPTDAPVTMRSMSNKRVWNRKMKRLLLPRLRYPDFRDGLADILQPTLE